MDKQKGFFDYCAMVLTQFGFSILALNVFCFMIGDSVKEYSEMFVLGSKGLSVAVTFHFLVLTILIVALRCLFCTDRWIKNISLLTRGFLTITSSLIVTVIFIIIFRWFPPDFLLAWIFFFVCFGVSTAGTLLVLWLKEKSENKKMTDALQRIQGDNYEDDN